MKQQKFIIILVCIGLYICADTKEGKKLTGTPISSDEDSASLSNAFDEDYSKEFKSKLESNGWVGLELKSPSRITKIGWAQKSKDKSKYLLGVFEGANEPSFIDAIPLYMITEEGKSEKINYVPIEVNYSFKYLRYVGPFNTSSVISGLEFYGYESKEELEEGEEVLYHPTNLPLVVIHTEDSVDPVDKETDINYKLVIIENGKRDSKGKGTIKLRGNSTVGGAKKPYRIKFESKKKLLDFPAKAKKWNLLANWYDKTLIRNSLANKLSTLVGMKYSPICRFVDLMLNGEFKGNYYLCDNVEVGKNRVELAEMDENSNEEPEISGGYLIEAMGHATYNQEEVSHRTDKGIVYIVRYPKKGDITPEQTKYIEKKLSEVEAEVYNGNYDNIDLDSVVKYAIAQELAANMDMLWSCYMTKERDDDKIYFGPLWDFDLAFGNDGRAKPLDSKTNFLFKYASSSGTMNEFYTKIYNNPEAIKKLKEKWKELTKSKITKKVLTDFIDEQAKLIEKSRKLNFLRWDILKRRINFGKEELCTYSKQIEFTKEFLSENFDRLDGIIEKATIDLINEKVPNNGWGFGGGDGGFNFTWGEGGFGGFNFTGGEGGFGGFNFTGGEGGFNFTGGEGGFDFGDFDWSQFDWGGNRDPLGQIEETCIGQEDED